MDRHVAALILSRLVHVLGVEVSPHSKFPCTLLGEYEAVASLEVPTALLPSLAKLNGVEGAKGAVLGGEQGTAVGRARKNRWIWVDVAKSAWLMATTTAAAPAQ